MNFIVLDLEWNQCPYGKARENPLLPFEVIEIGAVRLNEAHEILDEFHETIRPQLYKELHYRTRQIVRLRDIDLRSSRFFPEVFRDFIAWCGTDPLFCSWGPADLTELQRNLTYHKMEIPFPFPFFYYDLQKIFSIIYEERHIRRSLEYAVDYLHIQKEISFHDALSDARYTARVMQHLDHSILMTYSSVDYFRTPASREEEITLDYPDYTKFVSRPFSSKTQAMRDPVVTMVLCPVCKEKASRRLSWYSHGARNYYSIFFCKQHGFIKGKIRMRQHAPHRFYTVKTLRLITQEEMQALKEQKQKHLHA